MRVVDFADKKPTLLLEKYLSQPLFGRGIFIDAAGNVATRFTLKTVGSFDGSTITLHENLRYESGETHQRTFLIRKLDEHNYEATCDELVGVGKIEVFGNALRWRYYLKEDSTQGKNITVYFDDWMFASEDGYLLDYARVSKFGFPVGTVFLAINPEPTLPGTR